jgi:hypothetical protein
MLNNAASENIVCGVEYAKIAFGLADVDTRDGDILRY